VDNWNNITNSQNRVRKKSFGGTFCFSNCHIIRLDTGGLVFLVSGPNRIPNGFYPIHLPNDTMSIVQADMLSSKIAELY
jgi:hypothetical protein